MKIQAINLTDGYKVDHRRQYPERTTLVYSNFTPRKSRVEGVNEIVFFGLQYFIKKYMIEEFNRFFNTNEDLAVSKYSRRINNYLPQGHGVTFDHIRELHKLQYLPIVIKALPEGSVVPMRVPPITIHNTKGMDSFFWLVNYFETVLSCVVWGPCTSATTAHEYRKILDHWAMRTVGNTDFVQFQGHDFSFRGMFGVEAALMSGAGHLISFVGTDTIPAIDFLEEYYGADSDEELVGCSVAATEHSVMCLGTGLYIYEEANQDWAKIGDAEYSVFERLLTEIYPTGIVSIVSDTFNLWKVLTEFMPKLKDVILSRKGKVVLRPDSGDPVKILTGYKNYEYVEHLGHYMIQDKKGEFNKDISEVEKTGVIQSLWDTFGGTVTEKGYKLLDEHVGAIYGDSITLQRAHTICERLSENNFASINTVLGIGSYTYQYVTRDTYGWAMKATYGEITSKHGDKLEINIFKDPITDDGTKKSAKGLLQVVVDEETGKYKLIDQCSWEQEGNSALKPVFEDGRLLTEWTLAEIRANLKHHREKAEMQMA